MAETSRLIYLSPSGDDDFHGKNPHNAKSSFGASLALMDEEDHLLVAPGGYNESVTVSKTQITIEGTGGRGAAFIEPETAGAEGMLITVDDVTLRNLGVAGDDTADYSLQVGTQAVSPDRFRAYGCKFEGKPVILKGAGDVLFEDCEFAWEGALQFAANDNGFCTQVTLRRCRFHNITAEQIKSLASGGVRNLVLEDCVFDNAEDGTAPTKYLDIDEAGDTGIVTGCRFACATNEADVLAIAAGVKWVANATEAGISSARPS